jgi:hypothetical protein
MAEGQSPLLDWAHLPTGVEPQSLWECLHDGYLVRVATDALAGTAVLDFRVGYLLKHGGLPEDLLFRFECSGVQALRAAVAFWPELPDGLPGMPSGAPPPGRMESLGWFDLERRVSAEALDVSDATIALTGYAAALKLGGMLLDKDEWCETVVAGTSITVTRSDGDPFSLEQMMALGESYWEAFANRRK